MPRLVRLAFPIAVGVFAVACSSEDDGAGGAAGAAGSALPEGGAGQAGAEGGVEAATDVSQPEADAPIDGLPVTVDTYNLYLAGSFAPFEDVRRPLIFDAISKMPSDIVCIQEVWRDTDKQALIEAVKATFPYAASFPTTVATPVDDPTLADGGMPPTPTQAPCADTEIKQLLADTMECVKQNCSTIPGSDQGKTTSTSCAESACLMQAAALVLGDPPRKKCYGCAASMMPDAKIADIFEQCTTNPLGGLAFNGQNSLVLLSKHPLESPAITVLPGTWNRRVILHAKAQLPESQTLDVFCNHLSAVFYGDAYPYTGEYGNGAMDYKGWEAEQLLQIQKLAKFVSDKAGSSPAVILGDFNAGADYKANAVEADGAAAYAALLALWKEAVPASFEPLCTFCTKGGNTLASGSPNSFIDHIFLSGIDPTSVLSAMRTFDQPVVPVPNGADAGVSVDGGAAMMHLSDHYGMRSTFVMKSK